jgi:hypothetical protein
MNYELSNILFVFPYFIEISKNKILISRCTCCYRQSGVLNHYATATLILRDYYMTLSISALLLARDSHSKPDSEAGGLIWVEGWYQGRYGKFHVIIFLSHILHWPFPSIDFYIARKIFELTNCENNSLRELPLFNFESGLKNIPNNVDLYNDVRYCL